MLTLLHVFPTFALGGSQRRTLDLVRGLNGYEHVIVALEGVTTAAVRLDPGAPVRFARLRLAPSRGVGVGNLKRLRALFDAERPDLILTYNFGAIEAALANRVAPHAPHVHFEDGFGSDETGDVQLPRRVWLRRVALSGNSVVVVPSKTLERIVLERWRLRRSRVRYQPNGIDLERFDPARRDPSAPSLRRRPEELLLGSIGVFRPEKNFARLVRAFAALPAEPPVRLILAGDGPERAALERLAKDLDVHERVTFTGYVADPAAALAELDVFALTSDTEQMPYSLVEAMACGLPCCATDVGDVRALLPPEQGEDVVPVADEAALVGRLAALLVDPAARARKGEVNRAFARQRYGLPAMLAAYDDLFATRAGRAVPPNRTEERRAAT